MILKITSEKPTPEVFYDLAVENKYDYVLFSNFNKEMKIDFMDYQESKVILINQDFELSDFIIPKNLFRELSSLLFHNYEVGIRNYLICRKGLKFIHAEELNIPSEKLLTPTDEYFYSIFQTSDFNKVSKP